jgi:hypothetical protein
VSTSRASTTVRAVGLPDEDKISRYLKEGIRVLDVLSGSRDIVDGEGEKAGGASILTDGTWVWRLDLRYYLEKYHVQLDDEFMQHVRVRGYPVSKVSHSRLLQVTKEVNEALGFRVVPTPPMPPWKPK